MQVAILLATYNAGPRLRVQLTSLFNQTYKEWKLYIHDDGSKDETIAIIREYIKANPDRIVILEDDIKGRGARDSFLWLLSHVESQYYMFCDQDDLWLPNKIQISINTLLYIENKNLGKPICVFSDLALADSDYNVIKDSMWKVSKIKPSILSSVKFLAVFNCVTGCTMAFNKEAKECSLTYINNIPMHDWWIAINVVINKGILYPIYKSTILYCQHGDNAIGALTVDKNFYKSKLLNLKETYTKNREHMRFLKNFINYPLSDFLFYKLLYWFLRIF